ncbi:MAG: tRNA (N6-isopentenyl adenosine(37)-C2)-methylthiotransferase MiaB [Pseudomonadota bacterium]
MTAKKLHIKTYGCQMNVYDSERMAEALAGAGYETVDTPKGADMVLLNTCHIREKAAEKIYSELGRVRKLAEAKKAEGGEMLVGVAGCVAQAEGEEIVRRAPLVDLVVGPQAYHRLPEMEAKARAGATAIDTDFPEEDKFARSRGPKSKRAPTAFLTVQEGCDKFCAFCVVPYTRGAEISRPAEQVIAEARDLVERGVVEITLLGQNVNAYHGASADEDWSLARLIRELAKVDGLERIRYTTSHPNDMDADLIAAHADVEKLMPYLHLPVQAGSDRILEAMNRRHTADEYIRLIERIREARPDIALSGDFITGFPGETEAEFEDTMALVREVTYAQAYSFKYSARPGTPASDLPVVGAEENSARLSRLQALLGEQQTAFQKATVGRRLPILIEKPGREPGQMVGKSPYLQSVHLDAPATLAGRIVMADVTASAANSLAARLV